MAPEVADREGVAGLVDGDRHDLQQRECDQTKDVGPVERDELVDGRSCLLEPEREAEKREPDQDPGADPRERHPPDQTVDAVHRSVSIGPAGDIPDDQTA